MSNHDWENNKYILTYKDGTESEPLSYWEAEEEWTSGYAMMCILVQDKGTQ